MNRVFARMRAGLLAALLPAAVPAWAASDKAPAVKPEAPAAPQVAPDTPADQLALRLSPLTAEDLAAEARAWQALLKERTQALVELRIALRSAEGEDAKRLTDAILDLGTRRAALSSGLGEILTAWEAKGGDPEKIEPFRKYVSAVSTEQLKGARVHTTLLELEKWLLSPEGGLALGQKLLVVLAAIGVLWAIAGIVSRVVRRAMVRVTRVSALLREFVARAAFWGVVGAGLLLVLATLGVHVGGLLALVGGASFVLAFAMQDTLGNFAAGLMIMVYRPFDVGDQVEVAGVAGRVQDVSVVSTTITTPDNRVVIIPNGSVWGSVITNATVSDVRRVDLVFSIAQHDAAKAQGLVQEVVSAHPLVLKEPAPIVRLRAFEASSVRFACEAWVRTSDYWTVHWDLMRQLKERFDADGVADAGAEGAAAGA
jgi:small conductance mechanosensitive channel